MRQILSLTAAALAAVTLSALAVSTAAAAPPQQQLLFQNLALKVTAVDPTMTAAKQGIEVGDIIVSVNGNRVASTDDLVFFLQKAGNVAQLEVIDKKTPTGKPIVINVYPVNGKIGINAAQVTLPTPAPAPNPTPFLVPNKNLKQYMLKK